MENASKALLIAAGMLIALVVISLLIMMFNRIGIFQSTANKAKASEQVAKFNMEFEAYNKDELLGTEIYTLLNKVVDYNRRKSTKGINDTGVDIGYEPISIEIDLSNKQNTFSYDNSLRVFSGSKITVGETSNTLGTNINNTVSNAMKDTGLTEKQLQALSSGISTLYGSNVKGNSDNERDAIQFYQKCTGKTVTYNTINSTKIKDSILKYYEIVQFKRGIFKINGSPTYNKNTGRIIGMKFKFTGKFK